MIFLPLIPAAIMVLILWMAAKMIRQSWPKTLRHEPVTIVVCARDEEPTILECLISLSEQSYPSELYEILLVNHLSKDRTGEIMEMFAEESSVRTRVIHIEHEDGELKGKVQALNVGLDQVTTEYVLLTDGDCAVPGTWVEEMMAYMEDDVAIINGHVRVQDVDDRNTLIVRLQNTLNRMFLAFSAGMSAFQLPRNMYPTDLRILQPLLKHVRPSFNMGNNQGLRMSVYRQIGGFRNVGPTLIEDVALVNRVLQSTDYKVAVIIDPLTIVTTRPSRNMREYWHQYRRWASAMDNVHNNANTILYALLGINRVFLPWSVLLFPITSLLALLMTAFAEYRLIQQANEILESRSGKRDVTLHLISQLVLNHILMFALLFKVPVVWKGRVYEKQ